MNEKSKSICFLFNVTYLNKDTANIVISAQPRSENIEIKYATIQEPEKIIDFEQLNSIIAKSVYQKDRSDKVGFYIVNEKTMQKEKIIFKLDWEYAPEYGNKITSVRGFPADITDKVRNIGG
jgi:hypothetical protein